MLRKGENGFPDETIQELAGQKIKRKGTYKNDKLQGSILYFSLDGKVEKIEKYTNGVLTETKKGE